MSSSGYLSNETPQVVVVPRDSTRVAQLDHPIDLAAAHLTSRLSKFICKIVNPNDDPGRSLIVATQLVHIDHDIADVCDSDDSHRVVRTGFGTLNLASAGGIGSQPPIFPTRDFSDWGKSHKNGSPI